MLREGPLASARAVGSETTDIVPIISRQTTTALNISLTRRIVERIVGAIHQTTKH